MGKNRLENQIVVRPSLPLQRNTCIRTKLLQCLIVFYWTFCYIILMWSLW